MKWIKRGLIFTANGFAEWAVQGAMIPTPVPADNELLRIYLTFLDEEGIGRPGFVEVSSAHVSEVVSVHQQPILDVGRPGTFDESGVFEHTVIHPKSWADSWSSKSQSLSTCLFGTISTCPGLYGYLLTIA